MRIRIPFIAAATLTALVLAACNVVVEEPGPPDNAIAITANSNSSVPLDQDRTYSPGEEKVFKVTVPGGVAAEDLLYVELDRNLRLEVRPGGSNYQTVSFSATSYEFFGAGTTGVSSTAAEAGLDAQAITTPYTCLGSCVILESPAGEFYVRVLNSGSSNVNNVNLFVYGADASDSLEPGNDTVAGAVPLLPIDGGAIETVGDVDYFHVTQTGPLAFDVVATGIDLEAYIVDVNGDPIPNVGGPYVSGQTLNVVNGDRLQIWAANPNVAASSAYSQYYLEMLAPLSEGL